MTDAHASDRSSRSGYAIGPETCGSGTLTFPRIRIDMMKGFCAGLVASEEDHLKFPRSIVQIPGREEFVVADMGGWGHRDGKLLLLDPQAPEGKRVVELIGGLDYPFGLAARPDGKVYASTAETIFRFDPLAPNPKQTVETIIRGLPGRKVTLSDGTRVEDSAHPMKAFVFDRTGRIFVNIGSHSDDCLTRAPITRPCPAGEGPSPLAAIWMFTPPVGGIFPALKPGDPNPPREVYARGLRNSMALAVHPRFPDPGYAFLQGENARDLQDIFKPNEELNAIERGRHYGWPYCYDLSTPSPEFKAVLQGGVYRNFCSDTAVHRSPYSLLPPHAAPLGMLYYAGPKFPELEGKLLVGLHGYRPTGSRVLVYDVDERGFPQLASPPVRYRVSCSAAPTRAFHADGREVAAAPFAELVSGWHRLNGVRPRGAPVGMTVAADGAIWLVEDKNQTIIRIDRAGDDPPDPLPCDTRSEAEIAELVAFVNGDPRKRSLLATLRAGVVEKHCMGCHADFGMKPGQAEQDRDDAVLRYMLAQDSWIYPGDPESGKLRSRLRGLGSERLMPPGGERLAKSDQAYARTLDALDQLVRTMVPGTRMKVKSGPPERKFFARNGKECGELPSTKVVVVTQASAPDKPGFSRFYRPADSFLNGECTDSDGYYIQQNFLVPLQ